MTVPGITAQEAAIMRRRYLWMATSIFFFDLGITLIFTAIAGSWNNLWRSEGIGVVLLGAGNWLVVRALFEPIRRFLAGELPFEQVQRRLTQLPLLTARYVGLLALVVVAFRNSTPFWVESHVLHELRPTIADFIAVTIILPVFYFTYTYFIVSDYLAGLCSFIFQRCGHNLGLFFGSYTLKFVVALTVVSVAPLTAIVVDFFSYTGDRQQAEILVDVASAVMGVAITAYFIGRSLLQPITILSGAMTRVADGDLSVRVPVTSNDEVGQLTGRFNDMVEGLRERERIRETFGQYVDESVAATILRRQGQKATAGDTGDATILFSDIAGFTTIAEHLAPDELIAVLNEYLETVLAPIRDNGGVVNTFIGDGLFASFNMPLECADHAAAAVRAAIAIQRAVGSRTFGDMGMALPTRIGISTGPVIGGSVGAGQRMSFTLLGDTVNLAARLEQLNKQHGTAILVSESTRLACGDAFAFGSLGSVAVRGRAEQEAIFSVDPRQEPKTQEVPA
jgi:class 3 adenylate cyclase